MKIKSKNYSTLWIENTKIKIIDQTKLPFKLIIKELKTLNDNSEKAKKLISSVAKDEKLICNKKIKNLSKNSIITNIEKVKKSTKRKLTNILK